MPWTVDDVEEHNKGLSAAKKKQWVVVANSAYEKCINDGGDDERCAPSAIRQANAVVAKEPDGKPTTQQLIENYKEKQGAENYCIRYETFQEKPTIVVPVIMMTTGVHAGSHGPLLHLAEDLGRFPECWNGIPVAIDHPKKDDTHVSANQPDIIEEVVVGRIFNTFLDEDKLKAEAWLDEARLSKVSPEAMNYIIQGKPLDVSVGVFTEDELVTGDWNGEKYEGIARNHRPDHLALLPGGKGACSWVDGCGVRANNATEKVQEEDSKISGTLAKLMAAAREEGLTLNVNKIDLSFQDIANRIEVNLNRDDSKNFHYIECCYDGHVIYRQFPKDAASGLMPYGVDNEEGLWRQDYTTNEDGSVKLSGRPVAVTKHTEYLVTQKENRMFSPGEKRITDFSYPAPHKGRPGKRGGSLPRGGPLAEPPPPGGGGSRSDEKGKDKNVREKRVGERLGNKYEGMNYEEAVKLMAAGKEDPGSLVADGFKVERQGEHWSLFLMNKPKGGMSDPGGEEGSRREKLGITEHHKKLSDETILYGQMMGYLDRQGKPVTGRAKLTKDQKAFRLGVKKDNRLVKEGEREEREEERELKREDREEREFWQEKERKAKKIKGHQEESIMSNCCEEKIELLIQDEESGFTEDDRNMLTRLAEYFFSNPNPGEGEKEAPQMNKEQAVMVLKEELGDHTKLMALLPAETKAVLEEGQRLLKENREALIVQISTNSNGVLTKDFLENKDKAELEMLAQAYPAKGNYAPLAPSGNLQANEAGTDMLLPIGVE